MIDLTIPGFLYKEDIQNYIDQAKTLNDDITIIEVGAGQGRVTCNLMNNISPKAKAHCIDMWPKDYIVRSDDGPAPVPNRMDTFIQNTAGLNVTPHQMTAPPTHWDIRADMIIIDVRHDSDDWYKNIMFWNDYLEPGGIMMGTDFIKPWHIEAWHTHPKFNDRLDILHGVMQAANELNKKVIRYPNSTSWQLI